MKNIYCIFFTLPLIWASACKFSEIKSIQFNRDRKDVIEDIKALKNFQNVGIISRITTFDSESAHILLLQLINGKDVGSQDSDQRIVGKDAFKIIVTSIENASDFDYFEVTFIKQRGLGPVNTSRSTSYRYTLADLE